MKGQDDVAETRLLHELGYLQVLAEVSKALTSQLDTTTVLATIMSGVSELLRPQHWTLLLFDEETSSLHVEVVVGDGAEQLRNVRIKLGEGIPGWVAQHREPVLAADVHQDPRHDLRLDELGGRRTAGMLCVPLVSRGKLLGVIQLLKDQTDPEPFSSQHLLMLQPLADFAAIAIENARAFHHVEQLTLTDEWTTLHNARFMQQALEEEIVRAHRYGRKLSLAFLDLDRFKSVNDTYGHSVGSELLKAVALRLKGAVRVMDRAIRYGGDEFVVIMPETPKVGAVTLAGRLRTIIAEPITLGSRPPLIVTTSIGVAAYPDDATDARGLLDAADRAMYAAKSAGRNTVRGGPVP